MHIAKKLKFLEFKFPMNLEDIDFDSVEKCNDPRILETYLKLLQDDGGYYPELMEACRQRIVALDPRKQGVMYPTQPSLSEIEQTKQTLLDWERDLKHLVVPEVVFQQEFSTRNGPLAQQPQVESSTTDAIKAEEAYKARDWQEAETFYSRMPKDSETLRKRAEVRLAQGNPKGAMEDCQAVLSENPRDWRCLHLRGKIRDELGFLPEAVKDLEKAADLINMENTPIKQEILADLKFAKSRLSAENFSKVTIVEVSDEEDEFRKISIIEEPISDASEKVVRRKVPVQIVED